MDVEVHQDKKVRKDGGFSVKLSQKYEKKFIINIYYYVLHKLVIQKKIFI